MRLLPVPRDLPRRGEVSWRERTAVVALVGASLLVGGLLLLFAATACPVDTPDQPCPEYARNRAVVVTLAALTGALIVTPFAFLAEFVLRRRIVYRGAWWRAAQRGALAGLTEAVLAALRLGEVISVPVVIFVIVLVVLVDRVLAHQRW
jgi:hypothetical protein